MSLLQNTSSSHQHTGLPFQFIINMHYTGADEKFSEIQQGTSLIPLHDRKFLSL